VTTTCVRLLNKMERSYRMQRGMAAATGTAQCAAADGAEREASVPATMERTNVAVVLS
jgi:hypothetical protein